MKNRHRTLLDSVSIAPDAMPAADSFGTESEEGKEAAEVVRRGILVRVSPETWRALKLAAIQNNTTVQMMMLAAIEVVLNGHGQSPAP